MNIPFTTEEFFQIFAKYNTGIFPVQIIFYLLAFFALFMLLKKKTDSSRVISLILGFFWFWMGLVYHILYFSQINPAAYLFGTLFILQGGILLYSGIFRENLVFAYRKDIYSITGWVLITYALIIYPLIGQLAGHIYPYAPELSAPCPTVILTFGLFLFTSRITKWLLVIPVLWSLLGFTAALNMTVIQDFGLIFSGVIVPLLLVVRDSKKKLSPLAGQMQKL
jgi:hypothetical protein